jgi:hypothetical protein
VKHCFLCRWSFGATEYSGDDESPLTPTLKCHPNGEVAKLKKAEKICKFYDPEDTTGELDEQ